MRISDSVANYILELLDQANGIAEIQRNELAGSLGCVPSQINYVLTSRFTPEQGYLVESRRGGGGYIRITRMQVSKPDMVMHLINSIGDRLDFTTARVTLSNMVQSEILSPATAELIASAVTETSLAAAPRELRPILRASIVKNMLLAANHSRG